MSVRESALAFLNARATCTRELNRLIQAFNFTSYPSDAEEVICMSNPWWRVGRKADEQKILVDAQGYNVGFQLWDEGVNVVEGCRGFVVEAMVKTMLIVEVAKER